MRLIGAGSCRVMPWKNGGGTTTEIAVHPPGAALDSFDWRISMAHVGTDGAFSSFPGIDRTLAVLAGDGIALRSSDGDDVTLDRGTAPYAFPGEQAIAGHLVNGAIDDLNVMTRRGCWQHRMQRLSGKGPHQIVCGELMVLVMRVDGWTVEAQGDSVQPSSGDALILDNGGTASLTCTQEDGEIFVIALWRVSST